jgi:hypothetical protein
VIGGAVTSSWRYARAVKTEVEYGDPQCAAFKPGICNGHYSEIPAADGAKRETKRCFLRRCCAIPWRTTIICQDRLGANTDKKGRLKQNGVL